MPTGHRGAQVDPRSDDYQRVRLLVDAVERHTGAPSRWNGDVYEELDPDAVGSADSDGAMSLSVVDVLEPLRHALEARALSRADLQAAREAIATVVHEAAHLLTHDGDPEAPGAHAPDDAPGEALDEGLIEKWTRDNVDLIITDLGIDQAIPGVLDPPTKNAYPAYSAATQSMIDGVSQLTGEPAASIADRLVWTDLSQRWNAIAEMVIDSQLDGLMPDGDREVIRETLANSLRREFACVQGVEKDKRLNEGSKQQQGFQVGQRAARELEIDVGRWRDGYRSRQQLCAEPATSQQTARRSPTPASEPGAGQSDTDVHHLRRMADGGAPASDAVRVEAGEAARVSYRVAAVGRAVSRVRS